MDNEKWHVKILELDNIYEALILNKDVVIGHFFMYDKKDFIKYIGLFQLPIIIVNPHALIRMGAPLILNDQGKLSKARTIRALYKTMTKTEIAEATGIDMKTIREVTSRLQSKG
jgi:hypothetical protein